MSVQALGWVLEHSKATLGARLVLISIANQADKAGCNACPGITHIAEDARLSRRAVIDSLNRLVRDKELEVTGVHPEYKTSIYRIIGMKGGAESALSKPVGGEAGGEAPSEVPGEVDDKLSPITRYPLPGTLLSHSAAECAATIADIPFETIRQILDSMQGTLSFSLNGDHGLINPKFWQRVDALTEGTEVYFDVELRRYLAWNELQPPSRRHTHLQKGFINWISKAIAIEAWQHKRKEGR